jgi:hypothetical protein
LTHLVLSRILVVGTIIIHQVDEFEVVSLTALEIVRIVGGSDLDGSRTEFHIDRNGVGDNGDSAAVEGVNDKFTVEMGVPRIIGVDSNGGISQHGLGSGRGYNDLLV